MSPRSDSQNEELRNQSRLNIREAALKVFGIEGYHGASMSRIAREAGISQGLAYNYFSSKEEILEAVLMEKLMELFGEFEKIMRIKNPREQLYCAVTETFRIMNLDPEYWRLYWSVAISPSLPKRLSEKLLAELRGFLLFLEKKFSELDYKNPRGEAYAFAAMLDGAHIHRVLLSDYPLDTVRDSIISRWNLTEKKNRPREEKK